MSGENLPIDFKTHVKCIDDLTCPPEEKLAIRNIIARMNQRSIPSYAMCLAAKYLFTFPPEGFLSFVQQYATEELAYTRSDFAGNNVESQRLPCPIQVIVAMELFKKVHDLDKTDQVMVIPAQMKKPENFLVYAVMARYVLFCFFVVCLFL